MEDHRLSDVVDVSANPPSRRRKIQYHSQQLNPTGKPIHNSDNTNIPRNHSLEEDRFFLLSPPSPSSKHHDDDSTNKFITFSGSSNAHHHRHEYKTRFSQEENNEKQSSPNAATSPQHHHQPLQEFIGAGGGSGNFKPPVRAGIPPNRPPSLELRPRPLRDTQSGSFLRLLACTDTQLWAGHESGLRFWNFQDMYLRGPGEASSRSGDENAAPFRESGSTSSVICIVMDMSSRVVWSGHKDGKIRSWKMDQPLDGSNFKEGLSWRAHRGPVLSMAMSSYGDLWSGCEGGMVKIWPWETIEKSFSLKPDEKHMASLLVERSYIDLRTQATVNGICALSHADIHYLLSDNSSAKIWSAGYQSFALWDARTRELLKVFNMDGHVHRVDLQSVREPCTEDEMKAKMTSTSRKEKSQSSLSFFQRSRNALMGAADAVRRVAGKGGSGDDNHRTEALVLTGDGMIWTGCSNGLLVQWDGNGNRLRDFNHHPFSVQCLCTFGTRIWVGYVSGTVLVLDLDGNLLGEWTAHNSPVIKMAVGAGYVFTLANHGGIRGWKVTSPSPLDEILRSEVASKETTYCKLENLKLLTGTWNVGQGKASHDSLILWLASAASDVGIVVVGLQEVEMGAGFLAMSAARETVGLEGTSMGHWWLETIGKHLDEGGTFERIGSRQLAGLLIASWARKDLKSHIGDVDVAAVPCGLGRAIGNKGAVGLRIRIYDRIMCFVNCHLAAHLEAVNRRNADFDHVYRTMTFNRPNLLNSTAGSPATEMLHVTNAVGIHSEDRKPELSEADVVIFLGDLNYRLHGISYEEAKDFVSQRCFDWLRDRDQLRAEMKAAKVFQGMREALIKFPPTYKFQRHQQGLGGYDSSEKKRIPAWCDRVLYRDNRSFAQGECSLNCPVVCSVLQYEACMDVTDSDHKPVRCIFSIDMACIDESVRREEFGWICNEKIKLHENLCDIPETIVSTNKVIVHNKDQSVLRITNTYMKDEALFEIICDGQSTLADDGESYKHHQRGSYGFPRWLEVTPAAGIIRPGEIAEVSVNHEEFHTQEEFVDGIPQNWWCENTRDKLVVLILLVRGTRSTATKSHRIHLCHSFESKSLRLDSESNHSTRYQSDLQLFTQHTLSMEEEESKDVSPEKTCAAAAEEDTKPSLHTLLSIEDDGSPRNSVRDMLQSSSLQHQQRNACVSADDIRRSISLETINKSSVERSNTKDDAAKTGRKFHTSSTDERSGQRRTQLNKTLQEDLQHSPNSFADTSASQRHLHTPKVEENGIQVGVPRNNSRGVQSKSQKPPQIVLDSVDTPPILEEKNGNAARSRGIQANSCQQPEIHSAVDGRSRSLSKEGYSKHDHQAKCRQQSDSRNRDAADTRHGFEKSRRSERKNSGGIQSKRGLHACSDAVDSLNNVSMSADGIRDNKEKLIQQQSDLGNLNIAADSPEVKEKSVIGAQRNNSGGFESKTLEQHNLKQLHMSSDAANQKNNTSTSKTPQQSESGNDTRHSSLVEEKSENANSGKFQRNKATVGKQSDSGQLNAPAVKVMSENEGRRNDSGGYQPKTLEQHLNTFTEVDNLHTRTIEENSEIAARRRSDSQQQDLRHHLNPFSDAAVTRDSPSTSEHNAASAVTERSNKSERIHSDTSQKPELKDGRCSRDSQHSLSNLIKSSAGSKTLQQHLNSYSDANDSHHLMVEEEIKKSGAQLRNTGSTPFHSTDRQQQKQKNSSSQSLPVDDVDEKSKHGAQESSTKGFQSKTVEHHHHHHHLNPFSEEADFQQTPSIEEKSRSRRQHEENTCIRGIQSKTHKQQQDSHQWLEENTKSEPTREKNARRGVEEPSFRAIAEESKSGVGEKNGKGKQSKIHNASETQRRLAEERSKSGEQAGQRPPQQQQKYADPDLQNKPTGGDNNTRERHEEPVVQCRLNPFCDEAEPQDPPPPASTAEEESKSRPTETISTGRGGLQLKTHKQPDAATRESDARRGVESKTVKEPDCCSLEERSQSGAARTIQKPPPQQHHHHLGQSSGVAADTTQSTRSKTPPQQQQSNQGYSDSHHPSSQPGESTREKSKSGVQGHIQQSHQPPAHQQHHNQYSDAADTLPSSQAREMTKSGDYAAAPSQIYQSNTPQHHHHHVTDAEKRKSGGAHAAAEAQIHQSSTPQQQHHFNPYSDSTREKSKSGTQPKNAAQVQQPQHQHHHQHLTDAAQSMQTRERGKNGGAHAATQIHQPTQQQQHLDRYSDAFPSSTQENSMSGAHVNRATAEEIQSNIPAHRYSNAAAAGHIQSNTPSQEEHHLNPYSGTQPEIATQIHQSRAHPQQQQQQHLNRYADSLPISKQEYSKSGAQGNRAAEAQILTDTPAHQYSDAGHIQSNTPQQQQHHINPYCDEAQSVPERSKSGAQAKNATQIHSKTPQFQQPDQLRREKSKTDDARERESKTLEETDSSNNHHHHRMNGFFHSRSVEEQSKPKGRKKNSKETKSKSKQPNFAAPPSFL